MTKTLERIAGAFGLEKVFQKHAHHVPRIGRVLIIGGIGFIIQSILFETLGVFLRLVPASIATIIGAECAIISNFILNEQFSFRDTIDRRVPRYWRVLKFHIVSSGSVITQWLCVFTTEHFTSNALALSGAFVLGVGIGFMINYAGYYFFVWRTD